MRKRYIITAILALILPVTMQAQLKTAYFLDRSLQRTALNPAFSPVSNYFSLPVISGVEVGEYSNLSLTDFLYPIDGQLYTFLNDKVSVEDVMRNIDSDITSRTMVNLDLLGIGASLGNNVYLTIGASLRADVNMHLPKEIFTAFKQGGGPDAGAVSFDYKDAAADVLTFAQLAAGLKYDMSAFLPGFSVGVRAKYAVIAAAAQASIDEGAIYLGKDRWNIRTAGTGYYAMQGVKYTAEKGFYRDGKLGTAGGGILFDLGFNYTLSLPSEAFSAISLSASILDFGSLTYKGGAMNGYGISGDVAFNGIQDLDLKGDISGQISDAIDEISKFAQVSERDSKDNLLYKFTPTVYAGAEASFVKDMVSAGFLFSKTGYSKELTMSANFKLKAFNLAASYSCLTAKSVGLYLGIIPKVGISIFAGSDFIPTRFTPQYVPLDDMYVNLRVGTSIVF